MVDEKRSSKSSSGQIEKIWKQKLDEVKTLGAFFKTVRESEDLSQKEMGVKIAELEGRDKAYSPESVDYWERNQSIPYKKTLNAWEKFIPEERQKQFSGLLDKALGKIYGGKFQQKHAIEKMNDAKTLGFFIQGLRELDHLSQEEMGVKIAELEEGREKPYFIKSVEGWEKNRHTPSQKALNALEKFIQEKVKSGIISENMEAKYEQLIDTASELRIIRGRKRILPENIKARNSDNEWKER